MTEIPPFYDKKAKCISCGHDFTTTRIRSRFVKVTGHDTDFRPIYESAELNPSLYQIKVCPNCGFSFTKEFSPYFPPNAQVEIDEKITKNWNGQDYSGIRTTEEAINSFILAAFCGGIKKEKHVNIAGLYMRLAWLYRSINDDEKEQRFLNLAYKEYNDSYSVADYQGTQISEVRLLYILGELARRTGNRQAAVQNFSRVIEKRSSSTEPGIIDMARERWSEIREDDKAKEEKEKNLDDKEV